MVELLVELAILIVVELLGPIFRFLLHALLMPFWLVYHAFQQCWPQRTKPRNQSPPQVRRLHAPNSHQSSYRWN